MPDKPRWTESSLSEHYDSPNPICLDWLEKPSRHQFRWRTLSGPWVTARRRIASKNHLVKEFQGSMPTDVYVSTSSWLDPVNLPRLRDKRRPSPILLDHLVVFDIDMRPFCKRKLEAAFALGLVSIFVSDNLGRERGGFLGMLIANSCFGRLPIHSLTGFSSQSYYMALQIQPVEP